MSWKGFKKAVTRLPQQVMSKAGYAEETYDEDFEEVEAEFKELEIASKKLEDETKKYMTSLQNLMNAQKQFAVNFKQMMGKVGEEEEMSQHESCISDYVDATSGWIETMSPFINQTLQSVVLDPAGALQIIIRQTRGVLDKRGRKLVDYDRTRNHLKKIKEKVDGGNSADISKLTKAEVEFEEARRDYESLNEKLKIEVPILIKLRIDFMSPLLEALISFQIYFYEQGATSLQPLGNYIDFSQDIEETYAKKRENALQNLLQLSLVYPIKLDPNADMSSRNEKEEHDLPSYKDVEEQGGSSPSSSSPKMSLPPRGGSEVVCLAIAMYPFRSDTEGDLPFEKDEKIQVLKKTEDQNDWWTGRIGSREGMFPANYVKVL